MANKNPIVTITMENGDVMKAELISGSCSKHSQQLYQPCKERIL